MSDLRCDRDEERAEDRCEFPDDVVEPEELRRFFWFNDLAEERTADRLDSPLRCADHDRHYPVMHRAAHPGCEQRNDRIHADPEVEHFPAAENLRALAVNDRR